jgi:hypothetical protein
MVSLLGVRSSARAQDAPKRPDPATFESGDLLWPKPRGAVVPYEASDVPDPAQQWRTERDAFVAEAFRNGTANDRAAAGELSTMTFQEFRARYLGDQAPGTATPHGGGALGPFYVGHIAVVLIDNGVPFVVEAVRPDSRRIAYDAWLRERDKDDVWHGRLVGQSADRRALVARTAAMYVPRPYRFFNFDLGDDSGLYCSKLVWMATFRALALPLDDDTSTFRFPWYSPKRLMRSPHVCLLFEPDVFAEGTTRCS